MANYNFNSEPVRAIVGYLPLTADFSIDCYELPDGSNLIGFVGGSLALGHADNWISALAVKSKKLVKALEGAGWSGLAVSVKVQSGRNQSNAKGYSVSDYVEIVTQDAMLNHNPAAIVLMRAFMDIGVHKAVSDLFAKRDLSYLTETIQHYCGWTQEEYEEVLAYSREELNALRLGIY